MAENMIAATRAVTEEGAPVRRRGLKPLMGAALVVFGVLSLTSCASSAGEAAQGDTQAVAATNTWDKTFPKSDLVDVEKVNFDNRLGINLVGDLYVPKNIDRSLQHPAIIVGHPYGGVKEQSSGLYAQQMAERGFVTLGVRRLIRRRERRIATQHRLPRSLH